MKRQPEIHPAQHLLQAHYAKTALHRMGISFERGMQIKSVRIAVEGAVKASAKLGHIDGLKAA